MLFSLGLMPALLRDQTSNLRYLTQFRTMVYHDFIESLKDSSPPDSLSEYLKALWHDSQGNWHKAHDIADKTGGEMGDLIHAYLHRKEGDQWNASYWYRRANRPVSKNSLKEEWEELVKECLTMQEI